MKTLNYLDSFSNEVYYEEHINYAKGILYHLHQEYSKSTAHLQAIDKNTLPSKKLTDIEKMLKINSNNHSQEQSHLSKRR